MTKTKKIIIGTLMSIITLGGVVTYAADGGPWGKFGAMNDQRAEFIVNRISSKLDLNAVQKQNLVTLKDTLKVQREAHKQSNPREEVMKLLSESVLDETKVLSMLDERMKKIREVAPTVVSAIANFTNSLNDEQRAEIQTMADKFKQHRGGFGGRFGHHSNTE